jgi:hypothetical protein
MLHSGIVQGDNAMDIAFIFSWRTQCSSGAAPHPLGFTQRLDLGVRDGMSGTKRVIESEIIRSVQELCSMVSAETVLQSQRVRMPTNWHAMRYAGDVSSLRREMDRVRNSSQHRAIARVPMRNAVRLRSLARYIPHSAADRHVHYDRVPLKTPLRRAQAGDSLERQI